MVCLASESFNALRNFCVTDVDPFIAPGFLGPAPKVSSNHKVKRKKKQYRIYRLPSRLSSVICFLASILDGALSDKTLLLFY